MCTCDSYILVTKRVVVILGSSIKDTEYRNLNSKVEQSSDEKTFYV